MFVNPATLLTVPALCGLALLDLFNSGRHQAADPVIFSHTQMGRALVLTGDLVIHDLFNIFLSGLALRPQVLTSGVFLCLSDLNRPPWSLPLRT
jgi:hypothetical protein